MSLSDALERIEGYGVADETLALLRRFADRYTERGLISSPGGRPARLSRACPRCAYCWAGLAEATPDEHDDAIALPWIGRDYLRDRILVLGMNFHDYGGLMAHWDVCRSHIDRLEHGWSGHNGSNYAERAMSAVQALLDSRHGTLGPDWRPPSRPTLATTWDSIAYLQTVKCSPRRIRSEPSVAMFDNCPDLLIMDELELLRPRAVVVMGRSKLRDRVRPVLVARAGLTWGESPGSMERDTFRIGDAPAESFCLNHPSSRNSHHWQSSLQQVVASLARRPLAA